MLLKHVFFATPLLGSPMSAREDIPTMATDSVSIYYNVMFIAELSLDELMFVLAHEVMHIILKHAFRRGNRHPRMWNVACDFVINRILMESGCGKMPTGKNAGLYDKKWDGMSEEQIYDKLMQEEEKKQKNRKGYEVGDDYDMGGTGEDILDLPGDMTPDEIEKVKRGIDQKVAQAASMARLAGKLPGELEKLIENMLNPVVPWQDLLRDYMTRVVKEDESWSRRNRRYWNVYLPDRHNERMAGLTIIGDTSGSIGPEDYARIATEIKAIIEDVNPEFIRVMWADTRTAGVQMMDPSDFTGPKALKPKGGGGTDMRVPLKDAVEYDPPVVVLITDGYTPWPDHEPPYPLIVVCTTNAACPVGLVVRT